MMFIKKENYLGNKGKTRKNKVAKKQKRQKNMKKEAIKGMYKINKKNYRRKKGFLFFPKTLENQTRWWEFAEWEEEWLDGGADYSYWKAIKWLDTTAIKEIQKSILKFEEELIILKRAVKDLQNNP